MLDETGEFISEVRKFVEAGTIEYIAIQGDNSFTATQAGKLVKDLIVVWRELVAMHTALRKSFE